MELHYENIRATLDREEKNIKNQISEKINSSNPFLEGQEMSVFKRSLKTQMNSISTSNNIEAWFNLKSDTNSEIYKIVESTLCSDESFNKMMTSFTEIELKLPDTSSMKFETVLTISKPPEKKVYDE